MLYHLLVIPKLLLYFCLIPWAAALVFKTIDCILVLKYLDWLWIPDFCMVIFANLSDYLVELTVFALFGIFSAYVFFGRPYKAVLLTVLALIATVALPCSRYMIQHILLPSAMLDFGMLVDFVDELLYAQILLMNGILFLIAALLTKFFYRLIFKGRDELPTKMFSLKNPQNFAALIFCAAAVVLATILFFSIGAYEWEDILALIVEYVVNIVRFFVIAVISFTVVKWNQRVYKQTA